jgi:YjbE family integral membrane protein
VPVFDPTAIATYLQIVTINLVLSGDNIIVIGLAAAGLAPRLRTRAILAGIVVATVIRIVFALIATQLLAITGLLFAGGLLLLWVCWKMYRELREGQAGDVEEAVKVKDGNCGEQYTKTLRQAITQIVLADVSMSLDNVLAVAGAARDDVPALVFGLILSVVLMAVASSVLARLLNRYRWIAWLGLLVIVYVAVGMIWGGAHELLSLMA